MNQPQPQDQTPQNNESGNQGTSSNPLYNNQISLPAPDETLMDVIREALCHRNEIDEAKPGSKATYASKSGLLQTLLKDRIEMLAGMDSMDLPTFFAVAEELKTVFTENKERLTRTLVSALEGQMWVRKDLSPDTCGLPGQLSKRTQPNDDQQLIICKLLLHCEPEFTKQKIIPIMSDGIDPTRAPIKAFLVQCNNHDMALVINQMCEANYFWSKDGSDCKDGILKLMQCFPLKTLVETLQNIISTPFELLNPDAQTEEKAAHANKTKSAYVLLEAALLVQKQPGEFSDLIRYMYCAAPNRASQDTLRKVCKGRDAMYTKIMYGIAIDESAPLHARIHAIQDYTAITEKSSGELILTILEGRDPALVQTAVKAITKKQALVDTASRVLIQNLQEDQFDRKNPLALVALIQSASESPAAMKVLHRVMSLIDFTTSIYGIFSSEDYRFLDHTKFGPFVNQEEVAGPDRGQEFIDILLEFGTEKLFQLAQEKNPVIRDNVYGFLTHALAMGHREAIVTQMKKMSSETLDGVRKIYDAEFDPPTSSSL